MSDQKFKRAIKRVYRTVTRTKFFTETLRNYVIDRQYGGYCGGILAPLKGCVGANKTQSVYYSVLDKLFCASRVNIMPTDVLVDIGCGKGRVINYWLKMGYRNKIIGIDVNETVAQWVRNRLQDYPNVTIITGDVVEHIPSDGTVFFLFNPFDATKMEEFKRALLETVKDQKSLVLIYYNDRHVNVFQTDPRFSVQDLVVNVWRPASLIWIEGANPTVSHVYQGLPCEAESGEVAVYTVEHYERDSNDAGRPLAACDTVGLIR